MDLVVRDVYADPNSMLRQPRWALCYPRGPTTFGDIPHASRQPAGGCGGP
jgi:hypothetical protein